MPILTAQPLMDGITATAPSGVTLAGTIQTSGDTISIGDGDTAITLAANTIVDGNTAGAITLAVLLMVDTH